jgi:hypothetical protein
MRRRPGQFGPSPRNPTPRRGGSRVPPTGPEREELEPLSDPRQITACTMYRTPPKTSSAPSPMTIILVSRFIAATNAPTTTRRNTATEPSFKPKRLDSFLRNEDPSLRLQPDLRTLLALVLPSRVLSMSKVSRSPFLMLSGSMPADCSALTKQTRGRFLVLAGNLVREEDRPSQKTKTGGPTCKARFRSTRRCRSAAGLT